MLGRAYLEVRDPDNAITVLTKSLERYPNSAKALGDLGKALLAKDQTEEAIRVFERALSADPEDYSIHYRLFQLYKKAGQSELARHHLAVFRAKKGNR
jgi:Flp pilus assembly protein TadD